MKRAIFTEAVESACRAIAREAAKTPKKSRNLRRRRRVTDLVTLRSMHVVDACERLTVQQWSRQMRLDRIAELSGSPQTAVTS